MNYALLWRRGNFVVELGGQRLMGEEKLNNSTIKFVHIIRKC